ncbi:MAG: hypothetical protein GY832_34425 [Chloroflexi bacterium]|nr:hypothetical protein [Chloroflexota bacterium]
MSKSRVSSLISLIIVLTIIPTVVGSAPPDPTEQDSHANSFLLEWEWKGPSYKLASVIGDDGQTYTRVEVNGYPNSGAPGWPSLPSLGKLVVLPPSGDFGLELVEVEYDTVTLDYPVEPAPAPAPLQYDKDGRPLPGGWTFARDDTAYTNAARYPAKFAALDNPAWMRDLRLARLTVSPFRYHPAQQTLDVARRLRLRVVQVRGEMWKASAAPTTTSLMDVTLDLRTVLNPADLDTFRAPTPSTQLSKPLTALQADGEYKIIIETEGIYTLSYAWLGGAGLPLDDIDPSKLRLIYAGSEVDTQWDGDDDATFEYGERLLFYAQPQLTRYANYDVYWLTWDDSDGQRMASRSGSPVGAAGTAWTTTLVEENVTYDSLYAGRDGDRWFWRKLEQPATLNDTFTIPLETPDAGAAGELTVWLHGSTRAWPDPDHHVQFDLNGTDIGDILWEGKTAYTATFGLSAGLLNSGDNALTLSLPADTGSNIEGTWVDAIAVTFGLNAVSGDAARFSAQDADRTYTVGGFASDDLHVYDVTDPTAPLQVTGWTFSGGDVAIGGNTAAEYLILIESQIQTPLGIVAAKSLADPFNGADYIVITHPDFEEALDPLVAHRAGQGLRVEVVDAEAIYDRFGDGRMDPEAIHAFLSHAYSNWTPPAPIYVLLVGDATYDPRHYRPDSNLTYLPPYLIDVDPWIGETTSDHRYADLTDDILPELRIGRFPVNTPEETTAVIDKIINYETNPWPGDWNSRLMFGADNPSLAGDHHADADSDFISYTVGITTHQGVRIYLSETGGEPHLYTDAQAAQAALIGEFNRGALLYTYFGHASWHQEAVLETDSWAPLFHIDQIAELNNPRRWPVVLHMTCFTGHYIHRIDDTLDENLLRTENAGAVAVWGASGNGLVDGHGVLHHSFYQSVFDDGKSELGEITNIALAALYPYAGGSYNDLIDTYHLFGDPAMKLNTTIVDLPNSIFLPIIMRGT